MVWSTGAKTKIWLGILRPALTPEPKEEEVAETYLDSGNPIDARRGRYLLHLLPRSSKSMLASEFR